MGIFTTERPVVESVEPVEEFNMQSIFYHESVIPVFNSNGEYLVEEANIDKMIESYMSIGEALTEEEALLKICEANTIEAIAILKEMDTIYGEVSDNTIELTMKSIQETCQSILEADEADKKNIKETIENFFKTIFAKIQKLFRDLIVKMKTKMKSVKEIKESDIKTEGTIKVKLPKGTDLLEPVVFNIDIKDVMIGDEDDDLTYAKTLASKKVILKDNGLEADAAGEYADKINAELWNGLIGEEKELEFNISNARTILANINGIVEAVQKFEQHLLKDLKKQEDKAINMSAKEYTDAVLNANSWLCMFKVELFKSKIVFLNGYATYLTEKYKQFKK